MPDRLGRTTAEAAPWRSDHKTPGAGWVVILELAGGKDGVKLQYSRSPIGHGCLW